MRITRRPKERSTLETVFAPSFTLLRTETPNTVQQRANYCPETPPVCHGRDHSGNGSSQDFHARQATPLSLSPSHKIPTPREQPNPRLHPTSDVGHALWRHSSVTTRMHLRPLLPDMFDTVMRRFSAPIWSMWSGGC